MLSASCLLLLLQLQLAAGRIAPGIPNGDSWNFENRKQNYAVVSSSRYRPGLAYRVDANLLSPGESSISAAEAQLHCRSPTAGPAAHRLSDSWTAAAGATARSVTLTLRTRNAASVQPDASWSCQLQVSITDTEGRRFTNSASVAVDPVDAFTFVETDKAVYKPGQTVKFRVVTVDEQRRPILANVTVTIKDAAGNLVDKQQHVVQAGQNLSTAVMQAEFPLSDQPNLGQWSILATTDYGAETQHFEVDKYVLPKFEVRLQLPEFVERRDSEFSVRAEPRYTHQQPVEGSMALNVSFRHYCSSGSCEINQTAASANGTKTFTFSLDVWRRQMQQRHVTLSPWAFVNVFVSAEFTEKFTGIKRSVTKKLVVYRGGYNVRVDFGDRRYFLPGMRLQARVRLLRQDGKTLFAGSSQPLRLQLQYRQRGRQRVVDIHSGDMQQPVVTVPVTVPASADFSNIVLRATVGSKRGSAYLSCLSIRGNGYVSTKLLLSGDSVLATVHRSEEVTDVFYAIQHSGLLTDWAPLRFTDSSNEATVSLSSDRVQSLAPEFAFMAVGFNGNELLAVTEKMSLAGSFSNVRLTANASKVQPQSVVEVQVSSLAHSWVYVTGIDHSVNLISTGQSISPADIGRSASSAKQRFWGRQGAGSEIRRADLLVLTDFKMTSGGYDIMPLMGEPELMMDGMRVQMAAVPGSAKESAAAAPAPKPQAKVVKKLQVRKFFPESFIWHTMFTNGSGQAQLHVKMPDTITSWDITGFCVGAEAPLQAAPRPLQVTTFKKFFIRPMFPYSLVRGESLLLKVLVFNYHTEEFEANVSLARDPTIRAFAGVRADGASATWQTVAVAAGSSGVVAFRLQPLQLPFANVTVTGQAAYRAADGATVQDTDVVVRRVAVRPEGQTQYRTQSLLLNVSGSAEAWLQPEFPSSAALGGKRLVAGSELSELQVCGDVLGPALSNVGQLLRMPYGCGEQNMVNFAPAAAVLKYLRSTGQERPDIAARALLIMKTGYQRELTYLRTDGSYSAFGNSDPAGSTWLTAFVLSVYAQASEFIAIDPEAMCGRSVQFLLDNQRPDGLWAEPAGGRVIHRAMQGATGAAGVSISGYACAALLQVSRACDRAAGDSWRRLRQRAASQLRQGLAAIFSRYRSRPAAFASNDLAVAAYAAALAGGDGRVSAFSWRQLLRESQLPRRQQRMWLGPSGRGSVETSGYALLTSLLRTGIEVPLQIVRWLVQQQNSAGGFGSTQDTVVGLQAMSLFAAKFGRSSGSLLLAATWPGGERSFSVTPANRLLLQSHVIGRGAAARPGRLRLAANGSGLLLATAAWQYNLVDPPAAFIADSWRRVADFRLRLGGQSLGATFRLRVCAAADDGVGMHILSISHPSGFTVASHSKPGDPSHLQLVETEAEAVVFYFSELSTELCVSAEWSPSVPVLDLKPQRISVQNYYEPEKEGTLFHLHPGLSSRSACSACPDCPQCRGSEL